MSTKRKKAICGESRNSYYKTDHDATAMCLKEDYYSGLGSQMHAAYNTQILVSNGFIVTYYVSQDRTDARTLAPTLDQFFQWYGIYPKRVCADAGYGSVNNYEYCEQKGIQAFIKYTGTVKRLEEILPLMSTSIRKLSGVWEGAWEKEYSVPRAIIPRRTMLSSWSKAALNVTLRAIANAS